VSKHIRREISTLKKEILALGAAVEEILYKAMKSLEERNKALAEQVMKEDMAIDEMEVEIEEDCLKVLALHQPVAIDLRLIIAILKINSDLERVGDLAVNIAERSAFLATKERVQIPADFMKMSEIARDMLKKSLDSLVTEDTALAHKVCGMDDAVDAINREMYLLVQEEIKKDPAKMESLIHLLSISRHLERVADSATNIAEDVIYMIEGEIVRHKVEDYLNEQGSDA
jgi:phosphate transport system protein